MRGISRGRVARHRRNSGRILRLHLEALEHRHLLAADIVTGLIAHWQLEETAIGQVVVDTSGQGHDGAHVNITSPGGPNSNAAVGAESLRFDGVNDYVQVPASAGLDLSDGQFSQSVWIHSELSDSSFHGILGYHPASITERYPGIWLFERDRVHAGFGDGMSWNGFVTGSVLTQSAWNHVATTFDGTTYKVYVDGVLVDSTDALAGKVPYPTQQVNIGRVDNYFDGLLDDVRIYNRVLTQEDVTAVFATAGDITPPTATLIGVAHGPMLDLTVHFSDNLAVDVSSLDNNDVRITGSAGFNELATLVSVDSTSDGESRTAVYQITAPVTNGIYSVSLEPSQVGDSSGNYSIEEVLGTFNVDGTSNEPNPTGLVGHWKLDEAAIGQLALDASGLGNHGTHVRITEPDGPNTNAAVGDFSLRSDGVDDHVSVVRSPSLDLSGGQFTQAVWVYPEITDNDFHGLLGYEPESILQRYPGIWVYEQDRIHAGFGDGESWNSFLTPSVLTPYSWNHVVTTFDGTTYQVYVDGTSVYSTNSLAGKVPYPTQRVDIGRIDNYFDGMVDDTRIYTRALDVTEVGILYNLGLSSPGIVTLDSNSFSVSEAEGYIDIAVNRSGGNAGTATVDFLTVDGTAHSSSDYAPTSGTLTFLDGETTQTIRIPLNNDTLSEGSQSFAIALNSAGGGASLGTPNVATITITDDDVPTLTLALTASEISEADGAAATTATVHRNDEDLSTALLVNLTSDDTSEATVPLTVTIPIGQATSDPFDIDAIDDAVADGTKTVTISAAATNYVADDETLDVTDDESLEPDPTGLVGHWMLEETALGQTVLDASGQGNNGVHVNISLPDGPDANAAVGDGSLRVDGVNDYIDIPADTSLDLSGGQFTQSVWIYPEITSSGYHGVLGYQPTGVADRYPGIWVYDQDRIHAGFGDGTSWNSLTTGSVLASSQWNHVVISFDGTTHRVYVDSVEVYQSTDSSGKLPYATQQLNIGRADNHFIGGIDDVRIYARVLDSNEVGLLTNLGPPNPGVVQLAGVEYSVNETGGSASVEVVRIGGSEGIATVSYNTVDGSAGSPADYEGVAGIATFLNGETTATIQIPINDDNAGEGNETFSFSLDGANVANLGFPRTAFVTIVDDDVPAGSGGGLSGEYFDNSDLTNPVVTRTDAVIDFDWTGGSPAAGIESDTFSVRWSGHIEPLFSETYTFHATTNDGVRVVIDGQLIIDQWVNQPTSTTVTGSIPLLAGDRYDIVVEFFENTGEASARLKWASTTQALEVVPQSQLYDNLLGSSTITLGANLINVDELAETATIPVWRLGDTSGPASVDYATSNGTAIEGTDYTATLGTLDFAIGESLKNLVIPIFDDSEPETNEDFGIALTNPVGSELGSQSEMTVRILDNDPGDFVQETVISGLVNPTSVLWAPDGRMFIAQKGGDVLVYDGGNFQEKFVDISSEVNGAGDRGLLGLAMHPDFPTTPYVYLLYTYDPPEVYQNTGLAGPDGGGNRVARMIRVTADANNNYATAVPGSEVVILGTQSTWNNISSPDVDSTGDISIPPSCPPDGTHLDCLANDSRSHSVGSLQFGIDGSLFVTIGDGTSFGMMDPRAIRVQNVDSLSGKLLRIDPITGEGYADNPFSDNDLDSNRSKVYSYGLRNPYRFAIHPVSGEPYLGDVGWTKWEEINVGRGANFGWPYYEGGSVDNLPTDQYEDLPEAQAFYASGQTVTPAIYARSHADGGSALILGDFYVGSTYPTVYHGSLFFADLVRETIEFMTFDADGDPEPVRLFADGIPGIIQMATGPDGNVYYATFGGEIGRFVPGGSATAATSLVSLKEAHGASGLTMEGPLLADAPGIDIPPQDYSPSNWRRPSASVQAPTLAGANDIDRGLAAYVPSPQFRQSLSMQRSRLADRAWNEFAREGDESVCRAKSINAELVDASLRDYLDQFASGYRTTGPRRLAP